MSAGQPVDAGDALRASVERASVFRFLVVMGRGMHRYGTPVHRLERALEEIAASFGARASFLATPTSLQTTMELEDGDQKLHLERQNAGEVDLGRLARLDDLARRVIAGEQGLDGGIVEARGLLDSTDEPYPLLVRGLSFAMCSSGFACFLGASWMDVTVAGVAGLVVGMLALLFEATERGSDLFEPFAAFVLAFSVPFVGLWVEISVPLVVLAGLIILVPGLMLTQAVTELAQSSLVSGTSRLFGAALVFMLLAFGTMLGGTLATTVLGPQDGLATGRAQPLFVLILAVVVTSFSFVVMFRAELRDFPAILACGLATFFAAWTLKTIVPPGASAAPFAAFGGALVAGLTSNAFARVARRPALVTRVPAMMHLVPGSLGFRAVALFSANDALGGLELAFTMTLIAVSIATGLFAANSLVPPRQRL